MIEKLRALLSGPADSEGWNFEGTLYTDRSTGRVWTGAELCERLSPVHSAVVDVIEALERSRELEAFTFGATPGKLSNQQLNARQHLDACRTRLHQAVEGDEA